jgi:hypothetical protein
MHLIQRLKSTYPYKDFQMDPETAVITFEHEGSRIADPFVTDCGRFECLATMEYHIAVEDAVAIFDHNMPLGATFSNGRGPHE